MVALGDLTDAATPGKLVAKATKTFKGLDIVVNNAAIRPEEPFADITYAAWRQVLAVCLDSAFVLSQAALPLLRTSDQATIVNVGGLTAHTGAAHRAHVIAAKAGLVGLTRAMAHDLGADGVTVNCVAPGLVETDRSRAGGTSPRHHATRTNLVSRRGTPGEIAAMVRFLCGADARYVTGQIIHVNGGAYCG